MRFAICAMIKNEHRYLQEWIDYHLSVGFTDIYLYEDKSSLSHHEITDLYEQVHLDTVGVVDDYDTESFIQTRLYRWFYENYKDLIDWCAFIDGDEFIRFADGYSLELMEEDFKWEQGIYLFWKTYNANGHIESVTEGKCLDIFNTEIDYIKCCEDWGKAWEDLWLGKSFVNMKFAGMDFYTFHEYMGITNTDGIIVEGTMAKNMTHNKMWIDHYFTKSFQEWCEKIYCRGDLLFGNRKIEDFFMCNIEMKNDETIYNECMSKLEKWKLEWFFDDDNDDETEDE